MALDSQNTVSLYDFIYLDKPRILTLLAQLSSNGVQQSLKLINGEKTSISVEKKMGAKAGILGSGVSGDGGKKTQDDSTESIESIHDVSWSSPIQLLDLLSELGVIHNGTEGSSLGSIVIAKGGVRIFDVMSLKKALPVIGAMFNAGLDQPSLPPKAKQKKSKNIEDIVIEGGLTIGMVGSMLDFVNDSLQMDLFEENGNATWMTLSIDGLTINSADLALKYGSRIPGEWIVIGIIDSLPDHYSEQYIEIPDDNNPMKSGLSGMLDAIRDNMGRKSTSYSLTPLMVFRKAITSEIKS
ncbi:TPA: hypothetical protein ACNIIQ_003575 [Proteus mirabilis]